MIAFVYGWTVCHRSFELPGPVKKVNPIPAPNSMTIANRMGCESRFAGTPLLMPKFYHAAIVAEGPGDDEHDQTRIPAVGTGICGRTPVALVGGSQLRRRKWTMTQAATGSHGKMRMDRKTNRCTNVPENPSIAPKRNGAQNGSVTK